MSNTEDSGRAQWSWPKKTSFFVAILAAMVGLWSIVTGKADMATVATLALVGALVVFLASEGKVLPDFLSRDGRTVREVPDGGNDD